MPASQLHCYLTVGALLFSIGLIGFLTRRNMIVMFLCAEMMLQGVSVSLVAWGRYHQNLGGQVLVIAILTVAACEAAIALALVLMLFQRTGSLDVAAWQNMREDDQPPFVDDQIPEQPSDKREWPHLTPAGVEPAGSREEVLYRNHV